MLVYFDCFIKSANGLLTTLGFFAALFFVIAQIPTLRVAMGTLIGKLAQMQSLEGINLKMAFSDTTVLEALSIFKQLEPAQRTTLRANLQ